MHVIIVTMLIFFCTELYISLDQLLSMLENLIIYRTVGFNIFTRNSFGPYMTHERVINHCMFKKVKNIRSPQCPMRYEKEEDLP